MTSEDPTVDTILKDTCASPNQTSGDTVTNGETSCQNLQSSFGNQSSSRNVTAPGHTFGNKCESDVNMLEGTRPGPGNYQSHSSLGDQHLSANMTGRSSKFSEGNRWSNFKDEQIDMTVTPAAEEYKEAKGWLGDAPSFSFGGGGKRHNTTGAPGNRPSCVDAPGPGTYTLASSLGPQSKSNRRTSPLPKFGTSTRLNEEKVYLTHSHERALVGKHSPAPNKYKASSSIGSQCTSQFKTASSAKFGSSDRFSEIRNADKKEEFLTTPGPGAYKIRS